MARFKLVFLVLVLLHSPAIILAQSPPLPEKENIYVVVKDMQGQSLEGYLLLPQEVTVSTEDNKEKTIPMSIIESIKVEKKQGLPGVEELGRESYYSVRLQNSQEILRLEDKYTLNLNTSVGVVTKNLDPDAVKTSSQNSSLQDSNLASKPESDESLIRDQSVILSLEVKF